MAYADHSSGPLPGGLPSEFIRRPVVPNPGSGTGSNGGSRVDASLRTARRVSADMRLPCMLYAAVSVLPANLPADVDLAIGETRRAPGVVHVITYSGLICGQTGVARPEVAVVARGYWLARQALARLIDRIGAPSALPAPAGRGDMSCESRVTRGTAHFVDGRLRLWLATSEVENTRALAARLAGISKECVDVRVVGGAEGAAPLDIVTAALALARELQPAPVQVILAPAVVVPLGAVPRLPASKAPDATTAHGSAAQPLAA